jgi:hypothetical protein
LSSASFQQPVPCTRCGYDLRGTPIGGVCPECGTSFLASQRGIRVDGKHLVIRSGATLPNRCIKSGKDGGEAKTKTLYWFHSAFILLILAGGLGMIVLLILYFTMRKPVQLTYCMLPEVKRNILIKQTVAGCVTIGSIVLAIVACSNESPELGFTAAGGILIGIILLLVWGNVLSVTKNVNEEFWIRGMNRDFLEYVRTMEQPLHAPPPPSVPPPPIQ